MTTLITIILALLAIILALLAIILALLALAGAMYLAIVIYHEWRWRNIKSNKYDQHNKH